MSKADLASNALAIGAHIAMQVSAKTGDKVEKLFTDLGIELIKRDSSVKIARALDVVAEKRKTRNPRASDIIQKAPIKIIPTSV